MLKLDLVATLRDVALFDKVSDNCFSMWNAGVWLLFSLFLIDLIEAYSRRVDLSVFYWSISAARCCCDMLLVDKDLKSRLDNTLVAQLLLRDSCFSKSIF